MPNDVRSSVTEVAFAAIFPTPVPITRVMVPFGYAARIVAVEYTLTNLPTTTTSYTGNIGLSLRPNRVAYAGANRFSIDNDVVAPYVYHQMFSDAGGASGRGLGSDAPHYRVDLESYDYQFIVRPEFVGQASGATAITWRTDVLYRLVRVSPQERAAILAYQQVNIGGL